MKANVEPAPGNAKKQPYATQEDAERYFANWRLMRQLEEEQKELGEKLKLAMMDGDKFQDELYRLSLVEPMVTTINKDKFIEKYGEKQYIISSSLQIKLVKEHMSPAEYKAMLEEGDVARLSPGTPSLRVNPV